MGGRRASPFDNVVFGILGAKCQLIAAQEAAQSIGELVGSRCRVTIYTLQYSDLPIEILEISLLAVLFFLKCLKVFLELRVLIEEIRNMEVFDALSSLRRLRVVEINLYVASDKTGLMMR